MKKSIYERVSTEAFDAIVAKYWQPDKNGMLEIKEWMVEEMMAWDQAHNTGPNKVKPN